ncbi:MAG: pilus assembly protein PilM [Thermoguttaceae bacterium]|nr:pilus assembly protein PilM [Thermoguttaceae bacterium]
MVAWWNTHRCGPIGVDIGSHCVKLLQFNADLSKVREAARWDLAAGPDTPAEDRDEQVVAALARAREGRDFRGRKAVFCLGAGQLFVQNIRVSQVPGPELQRVVQAEAAGRLPFAAGEAEIRFIDVADVRQGEASRREVVLLACHRPLIDRLLGIAERASLEVAAIEVEPVAVLRSYVKQFRRQEDQQQRMMYVNIGAASTVVVIAQGMEVRFVKYIDVGGRHFDQAVARHLQMRLPEASALRRHNGDRRVDQRDPEITRSIAESVHPVMEQLAGEVSMCVRYYSVTFRGQPLARAILSGGEATESLAEWLQSRLDLVFEVGDPLRSFEKPTLAGRNAQWDVAAGLALCETA